MNSDRSKNTGSTQGSQKSSASAGGQHPSGMTRTSPMGDPTGAPFGNDQQAGDALQAQGGQGSQRAQAQGSQGQGLQSQSQSQSRPQAQGSQSQSQSRPQAQGSQSSQQGLSSQQGSQRSQAQQGSQSGRPDASGTLSQGASGDSQRQQPGQPRADTDRGNAAGNQRSERSR